MFERVRAALAATLLGLGLAGCNNSPLPAGAAQKNTLYYTFDERSPRYLDPVASYSNPESVYTFAIYEPLYGYHYLKRPYQLIPKAATEVVTPRYLDAQGQPLPADAPAELIAESVYDIRLKAGILFQPHPAFAKDEQGRYRYHAMTREQVGNKRSPWDFEHQGTRELVAEDYVHGLKRHATTRIETPVAAVFAEVLIGLKDYTALIKAEDQKLLAGLPADIRDKPFLDFRRWPLAGVSAPEKHLLRIRLKGKYPPWQYWMAMPFTAPMPWEAEMFYSQPGMNDNGLTLNQWPVGTGPYMMKTFERDRLHVLVRNPNYRGEPYPCEGMPEDKAAGLLDDCGKTMPFIDTLHVSIEKEKIPRKEKFKQGYLDLPEIERSEWGVEFRVDMDESEDVRKLYESRGFQFPLLTDISNWYLGFNMLDPVVGRGATPEEDEKHRKLRHAISIAIDWEEGYGRIFKQKGGVAAHSPVPPGLFGSREGQGDFHNPVTHRWVPDDKGGKAVRRSINEAKALLAEAGYPGGRDVKTGRPLVLNYDFQRAVTPEFKVENDWMIKQFAKLGIQLEVRATDFNQYQDKILKGKHQIFFGGWFADYPDAENFLFLLYGPNAKSKTEGENNANYESPAYDALFQQMKTLDNGPARQAAIDRMVQLVQQDAPWSFGYIPWGGLAFQPWVHNGKPSILIRDMAKYYRVDTALRSTRQREWNQPVWWPVALLALLPLAAGWVAWRAWRRREQAVGR
ncbi:MAG: ABC transporter substrate-binding protein [Rubrivivax sp.]|nr:ABC transporter substrate-binding protein [Rubrivivax sp.]